MYSCEKCGKFVMDGTDGINLCPYCRKTDKVLNEIADLRAQLADAQETIAVKECMFDFLVCNVNCRENGEGCEHKPCQTLTKARNDYEKQARQEVEREG